VEGTREGEVYGSIPNKRVARKMPRLATSTETGGWGGPNKNKIFYYF
jgi:hypothetical protein